MSPFLANRRSCVFALTYGLRDSVDLGVYQAGGMKRMQESARELKRFVGRVLRATGARKVDIVGHSQGSLMPNYWVRLRRCGAVLRLLPAVPARLGVHAQDESRGGPAEPGVDYTMIMTRNDGLVQPWQSGYMGGARNFVVQEECALDQSEHLSIIFDPVTAGLIQNALDPRHPEPVPCTVVLPFVGAPTYQDD